VNVQTVQSRLWAWLFGNGMAYKRTVINGQVVERGLKRDEVNQMVNDLLPDIVSQIVTSHDWDFTMVESSTTTVSGTSVYTLRGDNDDARDILNVRYGAGRGYVLERLNTLQTDRREGEDTDDGTTSDDGLVYGYTVYGRSDDGKPQIKLYDTPTEAKTLTYRYRKGGLTVVDLPEEFGRTVMNFMIGQFKAEYLMLAERSLKEIIARYTVGGDEYETVRKDPVIEAGNLRRHGLQGGC